MREYDITLFGATGFTGVLTADYLASKRTNEDFSLALAGRNKGKLLGLKYELEKKYKGSEIDIFLADVDEEPSIRKMAEATKVLVSTVGPYLLYGETVVRACVVSGTHYLDLTGEGSFVEQMEQKYHKRALESESKIINCCGYDSIPADFGTYFTIKHLPTTELKEVECFVSATSKDLSSAFSSVSSGTWNSALGFLNLQEIERQRDMYAKILLKSRPREITILPTEFRFREDSKSFGIPLPVVDIEVVLRSALMMKEYGPAFSYGHFLSIQGIPKFLGSLLGFSFFFGATMVPPIKDLLYLLKKNGEGPNESIRSTNKFLHSFIGKSGSKTVKVSVTGGDPGYGATSKMLGEAAICVLNDPIPEKYGVITPVIAMGDFLLERLQKNADIIFTLE
jgi:saccharopine dehydrogenase (NAD+, L-glutamate forming)